MEKVESIEEYYQRKFGWLPDNIKRDIGHFNVFPFTAYKTEQSKSRVFRKQDFYTISVASGHTYFHFGNKAIEMKKQGLIFSSPNVHYVPELIEDKADGYYCLFNQNFLQIGGNNIAHFPFFKAMNTPVMGLMDEELEEVNTIFKKMMRQINSEYPYKYDVLRCLTLELIHFAMQLQPLETWDKQTNNASRRIATLFLELLERQFPIDERNPTVSLRSASDFAEKLNIHVNYLNKAIKEITLKTTSQIIAERLLQEAKLLLKYSNWNVSEIAYGLGFSEVTHFHSFFKKQTQMTALQFRNI